MKTQSSDGIRDTMKNLKKKEGISEKKKAVKNTVSKAPEPSEILTFWKDEIEELQSTEFPSETQAIDFVLSRVLKRLSIHDSEGAYKDFLVHILELDPEMRERLSKDLRIKGKTN